MMKKILALLIILFPLCAHAGENDWHIGSQAGYFFNPFGRTAKPGFTILAEKELSQRKFIGFSLSLYDKKLNKNSFEKGEYCLKFFYKPSISLGKNSYTALQFGPNVGAGEIGFTYGLHISFEHNITLSNRIKIFFANKNILTFRGMDRFVTGVSIGVKIPINK